MTPKGTFNPPLTNHPPKISTSSKRNDYFRHSLIMEMDLRKEAEERARRAEHSSTQEQNRRSSFRIDQQKIQQKKRQSIQSELALNETDYSSRENDTPKIAQLAEIDYKWNGARARAHDENFIILKGKSLYVINRINDKFVWRLIPEKYYEGKIINHNTKVFQNGTTLLINLDDGFFTFHLKNSKLKDQNVFIEAFYQNQKLEPNSSIDYNQSLEINVISEYFGYNRSGLFYKLNNTGAFLPIYKGNVTLNNLMSGNQTIEIFYNNGVDYIKVASYQFSVASPWYFSIGMLLVYFLLISLSFYLYYKWNKIRYTEKLKLKEEELKHQKEIIQID